MTESRRVPLLVSLLVALPGALAAGPNPNIVLYLADDMGMGDTSAYRDFTGNADSVQLHTPNLERLARMGVRFTDAHSPASRCTTTRYAILTGRYPWRSRLKHWVLFGVQGDPLIEADRPTIASMLRGQGYATGMVGKWHLGLRYRRGDGSPAAGWEDADLTQPLHTTPLDHGFDFARYTSRSHGTSGPDAGGRGSKRRNGPKQSVGPGHLHGRIAVSATGNGKELREDGPDAYVLRKLGSRHSNHALRFLGDHVAGDGTRHRPFFLYYAANANHGPYTPDESIGGVPVAGASRTVGGDPMDARHDLIHENDVAVGRLLDWLAATDDPRRPGHKLLANTLVVFTSDNGAERNNDVATGPFRSHKGSCFEGGHRVPFLAAWPAGGVGDGDAATPGLSRADLVGLQDLYATFAEIVDTDLPDLRAGEKGAEDSVSVLGPLTAGPVPKLRSRAAPDSLFVCDHKERKADPAVLAWRDNQAGRRWRILFDASLARSGEIRSFALYDLASDPLEQTNLVSDPVLALQRVELEIRAVLARRLGCAPARIGGDRPDHRLVFSWTAPAADQVEVESVAAVFSQAPATGITVRARQPAGLAMTVRGERDRRPVEDAFRINPRGLGLGGGESGQVDAGEALLIRFDRDVLLESVSIVAGNGQCGGYYQVGDHAPLAIYCVDADNDAKDQHGAISDLGVLKAGQVLRLDSRPHLGVEAPGRWRLGRLVAWPLRAPDEPAKRP